MTNLRNQKISLAFPSLFLGASETSDLDSIVFKGSASPLASFLSQSGTAS